MQAFPELIAQETIDRAEKLGVALLLDGVAKAGLDLPNGGCMDAEIMPVAEDMKMIGTAVTVETDNGDNFPIHLASYAAPSAGYIMVIDGKGYKGRAYFGDLIMGSCQAVGYKGMVVDGCTRDREGNIKLRFPVYSRGITPRGPCKKLPGRINGDIMCGGVKVAPGDLVMGDSDGVCVIPREHIDLVLEKAEEKLAYENKRNASISNYKKLVAAGEKAPSLAPQWVVDMLNAPEK